MAHCYEESRGGLSRGRALAEALTPRLASGRLMGEIGVGTGAVAAAVEADGHRVVGVDISYPMLVRARSRMGSRLVQADAGLLPIASSSLDNVCAVWVLHLVGDATEVVAECGRVLRPGGRLLVVCGRPGEDPDDDLGAIWLELTGLFPRGDDPEVLVAFAPSAGLSLVEVGSIEVRFEQTPEDAAGRAERREYAFLWDLPDDRWDTLVAPLLARLRGLPEPRRPRRRLHRHAVVVLERS